MKRDNRPVKWSLVAAAFALSVGFYAEHVLTAEIDDDTTTAVVQKAAPVVPAQAVTTG